MTSKLLLSATLLVACAAPVLRAQGGFFTKEEVIRYTPDWTGERFPDGRPKVPDNILDRMKKVTPEEAWATLRQAGFNHEYEDGCLVIHPDQVLVGGLPGKVVPTRPSPPRAPVSSCWLRIHRNPATSPTRTAR